MPRTRVTAARKEAGATQTLLVLEEEPRLRGILRKALRVSLGLRHNRRGNASDLQA